MAPPLGCSGWQLDIWKNLALRSLFQVTSAVRQRQGSVSSLCHVYIRPSHQIRWVPIVGFVTVKVKICNPEKLESCCEVELLADTGAMYSIVPRCILEKLGVKPLGKRAFALANGDKIEREIGGALYKVDGYQGYASVVFGANDDKPLLGVTALEEMGLQVDPVTKQLRPIELLLL